MRDKKHVQRVLLLPRYPRVQVRLRLLPRRAVGTPAEQAREPVDVGVDGEGAAAEAEHQDAARRLGADAAEGEELAGAGCVGGLGEEVV